jgi:CheY-like chemotaxis protein
VKPEQIVVHRGCDQVEEFHLVANFHANARVIYLTPRQSGAIEKWCRRNSGTFGVRKGKTGHDPEGARHLCAPLQSPRSVAQSDKYLAEGDKSSGDLRTYKKRLFNGEPGHPRVELTTVKHEKKSDQLRMEKDRKTIAVIDDDNGIRQALKRMLNAAGFSVHLFSSAEEFLAAMDTCAAGCAIVDLELGKMSGLELACHPAVVTAKLPIILISGTADETARASAMALGCVEYLRKPFMPIELLGAVFRATQVTPQNS